jgi:uncharacterized protein YndB with AHSA1/START domain
MSDSPKAPRALTLEARLPATPEEVARMLTDPAEIGRWFAPFVEASGSLLTFSWSPEMVWRTRVEIVEPGRLVRWADERPEEQHGGAPGAMLVEWTLSAEAGGTRLRLVHSGFGDGADWDAQYDGTEEGWRYFLWHLEETLRHHRGRPRTVVWERRPSTLSREALGARLFGPDGLALAPDRPAANSSAEIRLGGARRRFQVSYARLPTHLWGTLPELGGAVLLVEMEPGGEGPVQTGLWLSTWDLDGATLEALRTSLRAMADAVFGPR